MLGRLLQPNVWVYETVVGVELLGGDKRAVCDTCRCSVFGKTSWKTSPWIFHLRSVTQGFHTTIAKGFQQGKGRAL